MSWYIPAVDHALHILLGLLAVASIFRFRYQRAAGIFFHTVIGFTYLIFPTLITKPLVTGTFDELHTFLQRFSGTFHLGFALFAYRSIHDALRVEPIVHFAKTLTAGFLFSTQLLTAYHLSEGHTRGVRFSPDYFFPLLVTDGVWFAVELYRLIKSPRNLPDEIDLMCKRTQRFVQGKADLDIEKVLMMDSALSFVYAFANFAFPNQILKLIIRHNYLLDGVHKLYSRQFGSYMLFSAIVSLLGSHFTLEHQKNYVYQRLLNQVLIVALHLYGHFHLNIYDLSHCTPFVFSVLYISLLLTIHFKIRRQEESNQEDSSEDSEVRTTVMYKKTVKSN